MGWHVSFENISAIILAGGKSSRLGRDKCDCVFEGQTFLNRQINKIESLGIKDIYVSGYRGLLCDREIVSDDYHLGPISGIYTCIDKIKNEKALVLSVDVPLIPETELIRLIEYSLTATKPITVMSHNNKIEPLIAVYDKSIKPSVEEIVKSGSDYSMKHLMNVAGYETYISCEDDKYFININYEEDLQKLISK